MRARERRREDIASGVRLQMSAFALLTSLTLILSLCLGGGTRSGLLSDVILQTAAIPLLLWALWKLLQGEGAGASKLGVALFALVIMIPLLQLLPMWPAASSGSVGRGLQDEVRTLVGASGSRPVTVSGDATWLAIASLIPATAIFLATLVLPVRERRWLAFIVIGFAFASVVLGLLQLSQGRESALRFYAITNADDAVGFFANRNHFSALLNCALVVTSAWLLFVASDAGLRTSRKALRQVSIIAGFTLIVCLLAAQGMTRSRAGFGLAVVATLLSCVMMLGLVRPTGVRTNPVRVLAVTVSLGVLLAVQYGAFRLIERFGADPLQDARKSFAQNTYDAIRSFFPFGSGAGTFIQVYPSFEDLSTALLGAYVNRAHNDVLEYVLEAGAFAALVLAIALLCFVARAARLWRPGLKITLDVMLQRAAACVLLLILLHSVFDYPLRTGAMLSLLAMSAGFLLAARKEEDPADLAASTSLVDVSTRRSRTHAAQVSSEPSNEGSTVSQAATPQPRAAWGQDVSWPEAWKTGAKKSTD